MVCSSNKSVLLATMVCSSNKSVLLATMECSSNKSMLLAKLLTLLSPWMRSSNVNGGMGTCRKVGFLLGNFSL